MDWRYNTIWWDQLDPGDYRIVTLEKNKTNVENASASRYVCLSHFHPKSQSLTALQGVDSLQYLDICHSNIQSLDGISRFGRLKRLELSWCLKLENDKGLGELAGSLEWLHINQSKKFVFSDQLLRLKNLKVLCLNGCGTIENLHFLSEFPQLLDFRFVNTSVVDGDLTPLMNHPTLVTVGSLNKRHYNYRVEQVESHLAPREAKAKVWVNKGEFETFRYKGVGEI